VEWKEGKSHAFILELNRRDYCIHVKLYREFVSAHLGLVEQSLSNLGTWDKRQTIEDNL
jgi:hypothetical protein